MSLWEKLSSFNSDKIMQKSRLKFYIHSQFRAKKLSISNECSISCKKNNFVQKHETVAQENLLFRGNPIHIIWVQVSIEMDRFLVQLKHGDNYFKRDSNRSPFITKSPLPLGELQDRLLQV